MESQIKKELDLLEKDRQQTQNILASEQIRLSNLLKNEMGKEINDVLNKKKVIRMSIWKKIRYTFRFYITKLFNYF